jgi:hypothetical protein
MKKKRPLINLLRRRGRLPLTLLLAKLLLRLSERI